MSDDYEQERRAVRAKVWFGVTIAVAVIWSLWAVGSDPEMWRSFGAGRVLVASALVYVVGLCLMAVSHTPWQFDLSAGLLVGLALSGTTFGVVLGVVAKVVSPEKRSVALGIAACGGSDDSSGSVGVQWAIERVR